MCGIAGFCNYKIKNQEEVINAMIDSLYNRGPDASGTWIDDDNKIALGHRRLSIIDISEKGNQPMMSKNREFIIAYNGEIYNMSEIMKNYGIRKETLRSKTDTEVLLEAIARNSIDDVLNNVRGMFSFALFDYKNRKLYLSRDRMGEKPLYYGYIDGTFVFASDLCAIEQFPSFDKCVDRKALSVFLRLCYIPAPYTIYEGIYKLEPGEIMEISYPFEMNDIKVRRYWDISNVVKEGQSLSLALSEEAVIDGLDQVLRDTIRRQMIADVPVGCFLSGGIDSSTVAGIMQDLSGEKRIKTFTLGHNGKKNEANRAKSISKHLGTDHHELYVTDDTVLNVLQNLRSIFSEPFGDPTGIASTIVSTLASQYVKVVLSGDGGDELFYGYNLYEHLIRDWKLLNKTPKFLRRVVAKIYDKVKINRINEIYLLISDSLLEMGEKGCIRTKQSENLVLGVESKPNFYKNRLMVESIRDEEKLMLMDQQMFLPDSHLVKMDRTTMYVSIESRVPLLDRDVVEYAWRIPFQYKYKNGIKKNILKQVAYKYVPESLLDMPKQGFWLPLDEWVRTGFLSEWGGDLLNGKKIRDEGFLDDQLVTHCWKEFKRNGKNFRMIWNILMFESWLSHTFKAS